MSSSVSRLRSLNRIPVIGSNEVESPNVGVAITYDLNSTRLCMFFETNIKLNKMLDRYCKFEMNSCIGFSVICHRTKELLGFSNKPPYMTHNIQGVPLVEQYLVKKLPN